MTTALKLAMCDLYVPAKRFLPGDRSAAVFLTFEGDKIKESHHYFDSMTLLKQIGAAT